MNLKYIRYFSMSYKDGSWAQFGRTADDCGLSPLTPGPTAPLQVFNCPGGRGEIRGADLSVYLSALRAFAIADFTRAGAVPPMCDRAFSAPSNVSDA